MAISWEREYLRKDHDLVLKLFDYRCIVCGKKTNEVHEIVPISHGKKYLAIKNRVPMCRKDHAIAHESTKKSIPLLQEARAKYIQNVMVPQMNKKYPKFAISQYINYHRDGWGISLVERVTKEMVLMYGLSPKQIYGKD